ncbi:P-loop containing nucleoside triphosphate hydrolase protein [Entophlyctis helioformis]|nr:P-loop containing nucleoside triphosphate hydrolase protein [Entophlyctis helioformis]
MLNRFGQFSHNRISSYYPRSSQPADSLPHSSMTPPPPPPPPTKARKEPAGTEQDAYVPFVIEGDKGDQSFVFADPKTLDSNCISLRVIVRQYLSIGQARPVPAPLVFNILGRLRALKAIIDKYNAGAVHYDPTDQSDSGRYFSTYVRRRALDQFSAFGFQVSSPTQPVLVHGLAELIVAVEEAFAEDIEASRAVIDSGKVVFEALAELYQPDMAVCGVTSSLGGTSTAFRVVECYYDEKRTLMGFEKSFHLTLEFVAAMGEHFALIRFDEVMSGWQGVRTRPLTELTYSPMPKHLEAHFSSRGKLYGTYGIGGPRFLHYSSGSFFVHNTAKSGAGTMSGPSGSRLNTSGRLMIDTARGSLLGHHASQGFDEPTHAMIQLSGRYRRWLNDQRSKTSGASAETLFIMPDLPSQLQVFTWPALVAFSFASKAWGHVLVDGVSDIVFNDAAFDQLVLASDRKRLIRALVSFGGEEFEDIIAGKSGGSVFLLHGPPGVGKTLTAEAIAEVMRRPLYYVTMGELGMTPDEMERKLGDVLDLCAGWNALTLIDEADVFLEKRSTSDILRNAMVCVMLRLLEYHQGILFLTTNRVREFDPAFESRVTVALRYEHLDPNARIQVWKNLISRLTIEVGELDYQRLGEQVMNGRQIKNAVRLALALAKDAGSPLTQDLVDQTIAITTLSRSDMQAASNF